MDLTAALPTFVVTLREGFEAALVVGIVLACLQKLQQSQLKIWVYLGVVAGIIFSLIFGLILSEVILDLVASTPLIKEGIAVFFALIAIVMLSWMLLWMTKLAKSLKSEIEGEVKNSLIQTTGAARGIFTLVFIAVVREGIETVIFIVAKFQNQWQAPALGSFCGLSVAIAVALLLFKWGVKINLRLFFQVMSLFLLLIVGGLVISLLKHLDTEVALFSTNWCFSQDSCLLGMRLWDNSQFLPDNRFPGILLKSLFGYRDILYLGQALGYLTFICSMGIAYWKAIEPTKK